MSACYIAGYLFIQDYLYALIYLRNNSISSSAMGYIKTVQVSVYLSLLPNAFTINIITNSAIMILSRYKSLAISPEFFPGDITQIMDLQEQFIIMFLRVADRNVLI